MSDKFEQIFPEERTREDYPFGEEMEDQEQARKRRARVRNKHRLIGLAAIVLLAIVVAPAVFRPSYEAKAPKAVTSIPAAGDQKLVAQVELNARKAREQAERQKVNQMSGEKVAKSLSSSDNMVRPNVRPAERKPAEAKKADARSADKSQKTAVRTPSGGSAAQPDDPMGNTIARLQTQRDPGKPIKSSPSGRFYIQVVATSNKAAAAVRKDQLSKLGLPAYIQVVRSRNTDLWSVRVGRFATQAQAEQALTRMKEYGHKGVITQPKPVQKQVKKTQ